MSAQEYKKTWSSRQNRKIRILAEPIASNIRIRGRQEKERIQTRFEGLMYCKLDQRRPV